MEAVVLICKYNDSLVKYQTLKLNLINLKIVMDYYSSNVFKNQITVPFNQR